MQHLLSRARVDERQLLDAAADWAAAHLTAGQDEDDVVLIVDETADEKSSADCAGAARQELIRFRQQSLGRVCGELSTQIATLKGHPAFTRLDNAVAPLDGFDPAGYRAAAARIATGRALEARSDELAATVAQAQAAVADARDAP